MGIVGEFVIVVISVDFGVGGFNVVVLVFTVILSYFSFDGFIIMINLDGCSFGN